MLKRTLGYIGVIIATLFIIGCTNPEQTAEVPEVVEETAVDEPDEIEETEPKEPSVIIYDENGSVYVPIHISLDDFYAKVDEMTAENRFSSEWERDRYIGILLVFNSCYMDDNDVVSVYHDYLDNFGYKVLLDEYDSDIIKIIDNKEEYSFSELFIDPVLSQEAKTFNKYYDEFWRRKTADKFKIQLSGVDLKSINSYNSLIYLESEMLFEEWDAEPSDKVGTSDPLYIYYSKMDPELYSINYFSKIIKNSDVDESFNRKYETEKYKSSHENGKINLLAEVNPRDMEAMYGIKDAPMYTDEEVAEAQENIKTKYDEYNNYDDIYDEKLEAIAEDYYKANQNFFGQLYDMTKDITKDSLNKAYADKNSRYFYDEEKGWLFEINRVGLYIYGEDFAYSKEYLADGVADDLNLKPGSVVNGVGIMISKDGAFTYVYNQDSLKKQYNMILDEYKWSLNDRKDKGDRKGERDRRCRGRLKCGR